MQHARDVGRRQSGAPAQLRAQQRVPTCARLLRSSRKPPRGRSSRQRPFADVLRDRFLVDLLPAFDAVGAAGIGQALARLLAHFVRIVRQQDIAGGEIGGVLVEDVHRELPAQHHEASHLRPSAIGDEQRVGADVEWRRGAEFAAP